MQPWNVCSSKIARSIDSGKEFLINGNKSQCHREWVFWSNNLLSITNKQKKKRINVYKKLTIRIENIWSKSTNNDIQLFFWFGFNKRARFAKKAVLFCSSVSLSVFLWGLMKYDIYSAFIRKNLVLFVFLTRQSQIIITDNTRSLFSLSLLLQRLSKCRQLQFYDKWYILDEYNNRKIPKG